MEFDLISIIAKQNWIFLTLIAIGSACIAGVNILHYRMKFALRKKGVRVRLFALHFSDRPNMDGVIANEMDEKEKRHLAKIRRSVDRSWILFGVGILFVVAAIPFVTR